MFCKNLIKYFKIKYELNFVLNFTNIFNIYLCFLRLDNAITADVDDFWIYIYIYIYADAFEYQAYD